MEVVGYITTIVVLLFLGFGVFAAGASMLRGRKAKPARLAGTAIPEIGEGFDISKRYDIIYSGGDYGSNVVERLQSVRIIGYVGKDDDGNVGKMYMRSRWLVVEFTDGRRAFLMPHSILSLQEVSAAA